MTDLDDLIRHHHGDTKKLREIRDTIRHDNFINTDDKNYVESLITMYLKNQSLDTPLSRKQPAAKIKLQTKSTSNTDSKSNPTSSFSSNKNLGIIAGVVAAIVIIAIAGFTTINQSDTIGSTVNSTVSTPLLVNVDQTTYKIADIISITGDAVSYAESVELSIENSNGIKIWDEIINPKNNGQFSTLVIAGGGGWENDGVYTLKVVQDDLTNQTEFKVSR
tara:strand:+ start:1090 stop:1749 length:660 start_codon:yes stop_codon:yes gene_type:complete